MTRTGRAAHAHVQVGRPPAASVDIRMCEPSRETAGIFTYSLLPPVSCGMSPPPGAMDTIDTVPAAMSLS